MTKKIFITIPWFLPAFRAGGPVQSIANLVREYRDNVQYYIFCSDTDLNGAALENIVTGEWIGFNDHTSVWYADHQKTSDSLVRQVEAIKPDVLYIIGMYSWHFNLVPLIYCKSPRKILSTRGMLHPGALSQKKWKKRIYLKIFKLLDYHHKVFFHATDSREESYINNYFGAAARIRIAANFSNKLEQLPMPFKEPGRLSLVSIALLSPMKNILMVLQALGSLDYEVDYHIYGPVKDHDYWAECKEQVKKMPSNISVTWHGGIEPSEISNAIRPSHVFILPSKSENFGHAFYEALSAGRPVITSHKTPWKNLLNAKAGMNVSLEGLEEMVAAISFFAMADMEEMKVWSGGARRYAEAAINMDETRKQYGKLFHEKI